MSLSSHFNNPRTRRDDRHHAAVHRSTSQYLHHARCCLESNHPSVKIPINRLDRWDFIISMRAG